MTILSEKSRERAHGLHGFEADVDDLLDQLEDVLRVVVAIGVVGDAGTLVGGDLVLVDNPVEGGAVAEAVFETLGRDAGEGEVVVVDQ